MDVEFIQLMSSCVARDRNSLAQALQEKSWQVKPHGRNSFLSSSGSPL